MMKKTDKFTTVKEIADTYGLSYQTVNRYSDTGLLDVAFKKGNIRYYDRRHARSRLAQISRLAQDGYSLMLIRKKLLGR